MLSQDLSSVDRHYLYALCTLNYMTGFSMKAGITGLPYAGKTTLFCALTGQHYESLSHGKDVHIGTVRVPDERLVNLYDMFKPENITYATMEYFDIAGQAAVHGKNMDTKTLQTLRNADSLIVVLDAFTESADPRRDFEMLMNEFALNDLLVVTNRLERLEKELRSGNLDGLLIEKKALDHCRDVIEAGGVLRNELFDADEEKATKGYQFLSLKPLLIVPNISEDTLTSAAVDDYEKQFDDVYHGVCAAICAEIEMEIAKLDEKDRPLFLESMGINESALGRIIRLSYETLGLISFFTIAGNNEVRAWTAHKDSTAHECAGIIHSDMERGFIRAETVAYGDLIRAGSLKNARDQGVVSIEGKDYIVQDGDVLTIRFSV